MARPNWETIEKLQGNHPTKIWAVNELKKRVKIILPEIKDLDELYLPFVKAFFQKCKAAIEKELPGTLFLGCRTHLRAQMYLVVEHSKVLSMCFG